MCARFFVLFFFVKKYCSYICVVNILDSGYFGAS